ncbi:hypothetical protein BDZ45DRAFT_732051 [Acephala macrosclerotiorum]|nr:hypothetical protein BDZ45DRAFT_732051 [Acephala macrosclerotiorum]
MSKIEKISLPNRITIDTAFQVSNTKEIHQDQSSTHSRKIGDERGRFLREEESQLRHVDAEDRRHPRSILEVSVALDSLGKDLVAEKGGEKAVNGNEAEEDKPEDDTWLEKKKINPRSVAVVRLYNSMNVTWERYSRLSNEIVLDRLPDMEQIVPGDGKA